MADRRAGGSAEDRVQGPRAADVDLVAEQRANASADQQAGGSVIAAAIIVAVVAAIDAVGAGQAAIGIVAAVTIVAVGVVAIESGLVAVPVIVAVAAPVADIAALGRKSSAALNRVFEAAQKLSGLTDEDVDELVGE